MAKVKMIRAMEKMTMAMIQAMGIGIAIDLLDSPQSEDESVGMNVLGVVCIEDKVWSRGMRVMLVDRPREERDVEVDEKDAEFEGEDDRLEAEEMEVDKYREEREADCVDKGRDSESLVELEKVGKGLCNIMVARVVRTIGFAIFEALVASMRREKRGRALT
jgi:hypothetical protein